ncbi:uncharacterized protein EI97DRAFT_454345 [Westerdykella ornata]|uniref:Nucleolar 27S pre-rRNA processing Urb2/Npa2 C-terminal domain-containing protein n=1 Tax=Westerdykella ornata TaxID=318751 RepID=A0A6A6JZD3_WESOR|nr:uncharacterized protein EI97DRAFT_454345 [Westerdykella ornata]KAF2281126.1 hypothetical protein EI97DRAFT_454345 [Westerdykella ornata]
MAATATMSHAQQVQTLPRLVAINKNFTDLNEQIEQARNIVGLPEGWTTLEIGNSRHDVIQRVGRAKAEWVLRWVFDKLKDEGSSGVQARSHLRAWKLLHWMIEILPASQAAAQLHDADFLSILERTLHENFDEDFAAASATTSRDTQTDISEESSETVQEDANLSRKRKRPSGRSDGPTKKVNLGSEKLLLLFQEVATVMRSVGRKSSSEDSGEEMVPSQGMKMVMQTETAQAARILKGWLIAVSGLLTSNLESGRGAVRFFLNLSPVLQIWGLRTIDIEDSTSASADQFSSECLIPLLNLYARLRDTNKNSVAVEETPEALREAIQDLEILLMTHIFAPSRKSFFANMGTQQHSSDRPKSSKSDQLSGNLEPLRAKILQAAQIHDTSASIPESFMPLFDCIPQLLDLVIRKSPSRTPKSRIAERPWLQAAFIALAECAGCALEAPRFEVPTLSVKALRGLLEVLTVHDIKMEAGVLTDLFWYHSGIEYPRNHRRTAHWPLISALVKLDADIFVPRPGQKAEVPASEERPADLARYLFDNISTNDLESPSSAAEDAMDIDDDDHKHAPSQGNRHHNVETIIDGEVLVESIIVPIMSAFARNRDLLGVINHWDIQLCAHAHLQRKTAGGIQPVIWEARSLELAIEALVEKSLTPSQISSLVRTHSERIKPPKTESKEPSPEIQESFKKAHSSDVILRALLSSIHSDDTIEALRDQLTSLAATYSELVTDSWYRTHTDLASHWITMGELVTMLWPLHLHLSRNAQEELLAPLHRRAMKDISAKNKKNHEHTHPKTKEAALLFLLTSCDYLRTVPEWDDLLQESIRKAFKFILSSQGNTPLQTDMLTLFCTEFAQLLEYLETDTDTWQDNLEKILKKLVDLDFEVAQNAADALAQTLFTSLRSDLRVAFAAALMKSAEHGSENQALLGVVKAALPHIRPSALPRDQREAVLDKITEALLSDAKDAELYLSVMRTLQEVPNATSKIASKGGAFFEIAQSLHDHGHESSNTLRLFQEVIQLTLSHVLPNKDQVQNKRYLEKFIDKIVSVKPRRWFPARLAVARAGFLSQKDNEILFWEQYSVLLAISLESKSMGRAVMAAIAELPASLLREHNNIEALRKTIDVHSFGSDGSMFASTIGEEDKALTYAIVAKARLFPNLDWFLALTKVLITTAGEENERIILDSFKEAALSLPLADQLRAASSFLQAAADGHEGECFRLLHALVSTLNDKLDDDEILRQQQVALLPRLCNVLDNTDSIPSSSLSGILDTINTIVKDKPSLTSQHSIECVLTALSRLCSRSSPDLPTPDAVAIYSRLCETTRYILLLQRSRLGGRFHLLLQLLQRLLSCLFIPHAGRDHMLPTWLRSPSSAPIHLAPWNASQYARILSMLCSPTQSSVSKAYQHRGSSNTKTALNDPVKAAREYVSHYIYPLLAAFCRCQLNGRLDASVREKLMPGIWEAIGTAEMDKDSLQAMYQGLDKSSREIWKGLWAEWSRLHGRGQGV